jgi:hypothetical protein
MPNHSIEIHDAILASIAILPGKAELHFSAVYIHQSDGIPGVDAGIGWFQEAVLCIWEAEVTSSFLEFPVHLTGGQTRVKDRHLENEIPLPLHHKGKFELTLLPKWQGKPVSFTGSGAELELIGQPGPVENFTP